MDVVGRLLGRGELARLRNENTRLRRHLSMTRDELARQRHAANHDQLTGLPNRRLLTTVRQGAAAILVDIDGFKEVNDHIGHYAGDRALVVVGSRLARLLGEGWLAARLGGDEFAAVRSGGADGLDEPAVAAKATALAQALVQPMWVGGRQLRVGCSIGLAVSADPTGIPLLIGWADAALAVAKQRSRRPVVLPASGGLDTGRFAARPATRRRDLPRAGLDDLSMLVVVDSDRAVPVRVVACVAGPR